MKTDQLKEQAAWWHSLPSYDKLTFEESVALTEMIDNLFEALRSTPSPRTYEQEAERRFFLQFNLAQATTLLECFGGEDVLITVSLVSESGKGHSGVGLYAHYTDYPEEGSIYLGDEDSALPTQPEGEGE